jgi:hypothetical protein
MTDESKEIKEIKRKLKFDNILAVLADLKTGLTFFQSQVDKVQRQLEELKSFTGEDEQTSPEPDPKQLSLFAEVPKKSPTVRRVDSEEEKPEPPSPYNIQVVGLGTTKLDF